MEMSIRKMQIGPFALVSLLVGMVACSDDVVCESVLEQSVSWSEQVEPLVQAKCNYCHNEGKTGAEREGAPDGIDYTSYDVAVESATAALRRMRLGDMPPNCEECPSVPNAEETNLFCNWVEQGFPE